MSSSSSSSSGLTFKLHPLVIVNISDHFTRIKVQSQPPPSSAAGESTCASSPPPPPPRVFGCVIGVQRGRTVEIFNSFELLYDPTTLSLDRSFLEKKQELYKKVFPNFYILGWYSTGSDAEEADMNIHKALMDINESPVYVLLNPSINHAQKDLPITIFESELHVIDGIPQLIFVRSSYTIETVEAERISVDHVAHLKPSDGGSAATQLAAHLTGIHSAIKMPNSRIRVLHHYLLAMQKDMGEQSSPNSMSTADNCHVEGSGGDCGGWCDEVAKAVCWTVSSPMRELDCRAETCVRSQDHLSLSIDRLTRELDQLLEDAPVPFLMQHASRISGVRKRVSSLNVLLTSIQRRLDNVDRLLSMGSLQHGKVDSESTTRHQPET